MTIEAKVDELVDILRKSERFFIQVEGTSDWSQGWKISIQGHTLEDSKYLFTRLVGLFQATGVYFKFGTQKLIDLNSEQSTKLITVYLPNNVDPKSYCELVRLNITEYKGADDIEEKRSYTKYAPGIFYRNDRDENGDYIPA